MWNNYCLDKNLVKFSKLEFKQNWLNIKLKIKYSEVFTE